MSGPGAFLTCLTLGPEGADLLAALQGAIFTEPGHGQPWSAEGWASFLASPGAIAIVAKDGDTPIGFVAFRVILDEAELLSIGTQAARRRGGLGAHLLAAMEAHLQGRGRIILEVAEDNGPARQFYAAQGFAMVGRRADYYRGAAAPVAAILMEKQYVKI